MKAITVLACLIAIVGGFPLQASAQEEPVQYKFCAGIVWLPDPVIYLAGVNPGLAVDIYTLDYAGIFSVEPAGRSSDETRAYVGAGVVRIGTTCETDVMGIMLEMIGKCVSPQNVRDTILCVVFYHYIESGPGPAQQVLEEYLDGLGIDRFPGWTRTPSQPVADWSMA